MKTLYYKCRFANAMLYYGLVLLTTALQTTPSSSSSLGRKENLSLDQGKKEDICLPDGGIDFGAATYLAVLVTTAAEAPGLLAAAALVDTIGRKWTLRSGLFLCSLALLSLLAVQTAGLQIAALFVARGAIEGTFSVLYIYTPEMYPTHVRSIGLSLCNALGRIGGLLAPFATVYLVQEGLKNEAVLLLAGLAAVAGVAAFGLNRETKGQDLQHVGDDPQEESSPRTPGAVRLVHSRQQGVSPEAALLEQQPILGSNA